MQPSPRAVEVFAAAGNTAGLPPCGIFSPRESRRRSGGSPARRTSEGQGAAGAQRKDTKRCEGAAGIESHGIDQKPERQESARIESVRVGPCPFCFLRLVTRPLCRYSSFLPFPSGLRALPRRPGHEPELPPCLR
nr:MAG TPA: restriction alleviation protein [Caudoviricetes sp.]